MPKRLNADEYEQYNDETYAVYGEWMALNEVNIVEVSYDGEGVYVVTFEFALWARGVRRWCKNAVVATSDDALTKVSMHIYNMVSKVRDLADKQTQELGFKCED